MSDLQKIDREIEAAAHTALINSQHPSQEDFRPLFVSNNYKKGKKVLDRLESELAKCTSFDFSVAFVTMSGVEPLLQTLKELHDRKIEGRILTTDYLAFSDPDALAKLDAMENIEVRMYAVDEERHTGFHTKGYLFTYAPGYERCIVGSANLTAKALSENKEWNLQFSSLEDGELAKAIREEFEDLWHESAPLSELLETYRQMHREKQRMLATMRTPTFEQVRLKPNGMQTAFVRNLDESLRSGEKRALLISATGTGKTYASAFAMRHIAPHRVLFLAHREQVLKQSMKSYERVLGSTKTYGLVSGNAHDLGADYVFATMQTMSKDATLTHYTADAFDAIIIDEVHRAGSHSYQKIMAYFKPRLWLGMTASPDRPDGFDIYKLFDNNIVYEIRLQKALEEDLLCPFHYFGISDLIVDGKAIDEYSDFNRLVNDQRVQHIIDNAKYYGYSGDRVKGLVFCRTVQEATALSDQFNRHGYRTLPLSGSDSQEHREDAIERLASDPGEPAYEQRLDYLFTVDIFNEGVDIPQVNQVLMLRPTESPIIFVQQLGRGLRKANHKDFVVVIDFIGNYSNNYMIPIALSGDRSYSKDAMRKFVLEGDRVLPGCSTVHFDEISRKRIFESIDNSTLTMRLLKDKYEVLRHKLGRIPRMADFIEHSEIDPLLFVEKKKSYYRFLASVEKSFQHSLTEDEHLVLELLSKYIGNGMRPHELLALRRFIKGDTHLNRSALNQSLMEYRVAPMDDKTYGSVVGLLDKEFVNSPGDKRAYSNVEIIEWTDEGYELSSSFETMLQHPAFKDALTDLVEFGLQRYRDKYSVSDHGLTLYEKYTRREACWLLDWEHDDSSTVYGYRVKYGTCPIFVTYNKSDDISGSTQYADQFETPSRFSWMTRSRLTLQSPEVQQIIHAEETGLDIRLFIKKSDNEGSDFYYFGRVKPTNPRQTTQPDGKGNDLPIVAFTLELEHPAQEDMYAYFDGPTGEELLAASA